MTPAATGTARPATAHRRWPRSVYGVGEEPDPRFTLANERTFLAWMRTSLALLAAGVAVEAFAPTGSGDARSVIAGTCIGLAGFICSGALVRWMNTERALRLGQPLPTPALAVVLTVGVLVIAALVLGAIVPA